MIILTLILISIITITTIALKISVIIYESNMKKEKSKEEKVELRELSDEDVILMLGFKEISKNIYSHKGIGTIHWDSRDHSLEDFIYFVFLFGKDKRSEEIRNKLGIS